MTIVRRAPRKSPEARREDIVAAVLALLAEGGAPAVSTSAIARRIGVTQSALFRHFDNKEAIWRAVMDAIALEVGDRMERAAQSDGSRAERILAILRAYLQAVQDIPAIPALLFSGEVQEQGGSSYLREEIARRFGWLNELLTAQLRAGVRAREFRRTLDVDAAALLAAGIAQSLILRWRVMGLRQSLADEAEKIFPLFLAAVREPPPAAPRPAAHR